MRKVSGVLESIAIAFLLVLILSVGTQIVMRNLFNSGSIVIEELARFSLVSLVFLMIPVLTFGKKQIVVDIVLMYLPKKIRKVFDLVIHLVGAAFSVFILVAIAMIMRRNWNIRTPAMRMPNIIFYLPVAAGIVFTLAGSLWHFINTLESKEVNE
ncbi:MAG TPA: TRAP transporter small permease subunit [Rectinemataceae bacterium]